MPESGPLLNGLLLHFTFGGCFCAHRPSPLLLQVYVNPHQTAKQLVRANVQAKNAAQFARTPQYAMQSPNAAHLHQLSGGSREQSLALSKYVLHLFFPIPLPFTFALYMLHVRSHDSHAFPTSLASLQARIAGKDPPVKTSFCLGPLHLVLQSLSLSLCFSR
jgi:hypothetical protein